MNDEFIDPFSTDKVRTADDIQYPRIEFHNVKTGEVFVTVFPGLEKDKTSNKN